MANHNDDRASTTPSGPVAYSPLTRRPARTDGLSEQRSSTFRLLIRAIERGDANAAQELSKFALETECTFIRRLMTQWRTDLLQLLAEGGKPSAELEQILVNLRGLLRLPGSDQPYDEDLAWTEFGELFASLAQELDAGRRETALELAQQAAAQWRVVHDREIDLTYGLMSAFVQEHGEEAVPFMFERIGQEHLHEFYELADPEERGWESEGRDAVLLDTIEAMRTHLSSTWRDGEPFELVEHDDRWVFTFDPCGSGGRAIRGDWVEQTPSRIEAPYNFATIKGAYPWTDGKQGICVYCSHCILIYEQGPMERGGAPNHLVEPPNKTHNERDQDPRNKRTNTIYKTTDAVPDEVYQRAGRARRPA